MVRHLDDYITSYGRFGKCSDCGFHSEATALIRKKRFCEDCKEEKYPDEKPEFQETDARFKCRAGKCGAKNLSFREILIGSCCKDAAKAISDNVWESKYERDVMNKIYMKIKTARCSFNSKIDEAEGELYSAKNAVRAAKEALKKAEERVLAAEVNLGYARIKHRDLTKLEKKSEKRVLVITKAAFEEHDEPPAKKPRKEEVNEKLECRLCLESYTEDRPSAIIIPCAHMFCYNCISSLPQKNCPNCRAEFTDNNVYKTH
ncbi:Oidioi.mRNA.OKI2018_I69.XSR.g16621.t1.cds [Oikopleura dioica]|uniref:Oidioi.mRNA.OKI2018_I69.XSR.g16621.t1.cds n=1 Tax=Oikopleura dioica TaxID=34765 RepID=A0ABN7SN16_OIKDI|nr:Oidioi.mRNA.OKI2018_I69.XSR.g16621.t1.cds [Oikopleura dioica]